MENRRLAVLAVMVGLFASRARIATAGDHTELAHQLFQLGIEEYKAKNYASAASSMSKAYELAPEPGTLYALAQSERMADNCKDAITHYTKVLDTAKEPKTIEVVKQNLELCRQIERGEKPVAKASVAEVERRDAPVIQVRTVYRTRTEQRSNKLAIALYTVGGISLGGAATTYMLSRSTRKDADRAQSLADYNDLFDRATLLRNIAIGAVGVGVACATWATIRMIRGTGKSSKESPNRIAIWPTHNGAMVSLTF